MEKFDLSQIKAGHLLVVERVDTHEEHLMTVSYTRRVIGGEPSLSCCNCKGNWLGLDDFNSDGVSRSGHYRIIAVFGFTSPRQALDNDKFGRELLWERKEPKKMTVAEICKALGYDVEIVKEGEA